jgi:carboxyl-terminal processing protease
MKPRIRITLSGLIVVSAAMAGSRAASADEPVPARSTPSQLPSGLATRIQHITDVIMEHHIDPPARQQMILSGIKALYKAAGLPVPAGLSSRVSAVTTIEQLRSLLEDAWPKSTAKGVAANELQEQLLQGLCSTVPGDAYLISAKDRKVAEQISGNRYVGIHVAVGTDDQEKRPKIADVFEGGPADRAGVKNDDLIEQIDGVDTKGIPLRDFIERLRGDEGTSVTIKVRQPKAKESRTYSIIRGQHARESLRGVRKRSGGGWDYRLDGPDPIAYVKIIDLMASTPHELRKVAQQLEAEGLKALVLDLRTLQGWTAHTAVLVADSLLESGAIGRIRTTKGETAYQAEPEAILRGWPLAVLVDGSTSGTAEWLAAALQDNRRAVVVGSPTQGPQPSAVFGYVTSVIPLDGEWSITLSTTILERGDGRPLVLAEERGRMPLRPRAISSQAGVHPDVTVQAPDPVRANGVLKYPAVVARGAEEVKILPNTALQKAVETLRASLKKT